MDVTYQDPQPDVELSWSGDEVRAGLVVSVRFRSLAALVAVERFQARLDRGRARARDIAELAETFVLHVNRWSITDRTGRPVPVTVEAFLMLDRDEIVAPVLRQWVRLVRFGVDTAAAADAPQVEADAPEWFTRLESRRLPDDEAAGDVEHGEAPALAAVAGE